MPASLRKIPGVTLFSHHTRVLIWFQFFVRYFLSFIREANLSKTSDDAASTPAAPPPPATSARTSHASRAAHPPPHPNRATPTRTSTTPHTEDGDSRQTRPLRPMPDRSARCQTAPPDRRRTLDDRRKRRQTETTTDGNDDRRKRRLPHHQAPRRPPAHREAKGPSRPGTNALAVHCGVFRSQRLEPPWNEPWNWNEP